MIIFHPGDTYNPTILVYKTKMANIRNPEKKCPIIEIYF
jgi:hypothetical protein